MSGVSTRPDRPRKTARLKEKHVQRQIVDYLRLLGATVYVLGTVRRKGDHPGTMQTPGIPDLWAFLPAKSYGPTGVWIEVKAEGGKPSPAQQEFAVLACHCGVNYICGGFDDVVKWLNGYGFPRLGTGDEHFGVGRLARGYQYNRECRCGGCRVGGRGEHVNPSAAR